MHTIRLHQFWIGHELPDGRVRWERPFGRPRTLDVSESAWLAGPAAPGTGAVFINGVCVGTVAAGQPFAFDITPHLQPRNRAAFVVDRPECLAASPTPASPAPASPALTSTPTWTMPPGVNEIVLQIRSVEDGSSS